MDLAKEIPPDEKHDFKKRKKKLLMITCKINYQN